MVWAYASFSQFMLIWAGNLPEEIGYYRKRLHGGWEYLAYFLGMAARRAIEVAA